MQSAILNQERVDRFTLKGTCFSAFTQDTIHSSTVDIKTHDYGNLLSIFSKYFFQVFFASIFFPSIFLSISVISRGIGLSSCAL